jgi:hypothetical protein
LHIITESYLKKQILRYTTAKPLSSRDYERWMEEDLEEVVDCSWAITYIPLAELQEAGGSIYTSTNDNPKEKRIKDFLPKL